MLTRFLGDNLIGTAYRIFNFSICGLVRQAVAVYWTVWWSLCSVIEWFGWTHILVCLLIFFYYASMVTTQVQPRSVPTELRETESQQDITPYPHLWNGLVSILMFKPNDKDRIDYAKSWAVPGRKCQVFARFVLLDTVPIPIRRSFPQ